MSLGYAGPDLFRRSAIAMNESGIGGLRRPADKSVTGARFEFCKSNHQHYTERAPTATNL
jgi:hypothetical protein